MYQYFRFFRKELSIPIFSDLRPVSNESPGNFTFNRGIHKVLKVYVFPPEYHYLGQACLKIAKILKINAHLEVAKVIQS